jgi:protein SCO1/2
MVGNFAAAQAQLATNRLTNWQLLTLTFDPEFDTPAVLHAYAARYAADPDHWSFLTGSLLDLTALADQCGVQFWRANPAEPINHNLRTVVVDTQGHVQKIFPDNGWTVDELVAEIVKAAVP